jgi:hypothetical protein
MTAGKQLSPPPTQLPIVPLGVVADYASGRRERNLGNASLDPAREVPAPTAEDQDSGPKNRCSMSSNRRVSRWQIASLRPPPRPPGVHSGLAIYWLYAAAVTYRREPNPNSDVVPAPGFEPGTIGLKDRCSNQAELRRLKAILN